jgi:predicted DNA-binding transcriptional regulator AlpA
MKRDERKPAVIAGIRPESRRESLIALYGPEAGRWIVSSLNRLIQLFDDERVLDTQEIEARSGVSRRTILRMVESGDFPSPILVSDNCTGWLKSEFEAWLRSRPRVTTVTGK